VRSIEDIRKEISIMSICFHKNVVSCYVSFIEDSDLWLVMPVLDDNRKMAPRGPSRRHRFHLEEIRRSELDRDVAGDGARRPRLDPEP